MRQLVGRLVDGNVVLQRDLFTQKTYILEPTMTGLESPNS